jgi:hypothetical protein
LSGFPLSSSTVFCRFYDGGFNLAQANYIFDAVRPKRSNMGTSKAEYLMIFSEQLQGDSFTKFSCFHVDSGYSTLYSLFLSLTFFVIVVLCFRKGFRGTAVALPGFLLPHRKAS